MTGILNKQERVEIRKRIFLHLDGWALIPSIYALHKLNILPHFLEKNKWSLNDLNKITKTNEGYLNVALRILASQGYLLRKIDNVSDKIHLEITTTGIQAIELVTHYKTFYNLIQSYSIRPKNLMSDAANMDLLEEAWRPKNNSGQFLGPVRLRESLVDSLNLVSIKIVKHIGLEQIL